MSLRRHLRRLIALFQTPRLERELDAGNGSTAAVQAAAEAAREAAEATKDMVAMRGRAAYTGERSRDSVDAGATAIGVILQDIAKAWREKYEEEETQA